jgi:CheY-like chemotaxis protein
MLLPVKKRLIIFDDDADILSICRYILEEQGWEVHTFTDCLQLLERVAAVSPDVILMDNWIADLGGISATQLLKSTPEARHIPVVYFSANGDIEALAAQAGADAWLAKPFDLEDLERVINAVLR